MTTTAAVFGAGFVLAALLRRHLAWLIVIWSAVRVLVPPAAVGPYFWKMHPVFVMILAAVVAAFLFETPGFIRSVRRSVALWIVTVFLLADGMLDYLGGNSKLSGTLLLLTTTIFAPVCLYLFTAAAVRQSRHAVRIMAWPLLALVVAEVVLGEMQIEQHKALVWEAAYRTSWWWNDDVTRAVGTTGHGLQLGILMVVGAVLLFTVPWVPVRVALIPVLVYGTMLGSARTAFVLVIAVSAVLVVVSIRKPLQLLYSALIVSFLATTYFASKVTVVQGLFDKFSNDGQSTARRLAAVQYFQDHVDQFWFLGYKGPRDLRESGVLNSSLENGYFAQAMVFGVLFTVCFTAVCLLLALAPLRRGVRTTGFAALGAVACLIGFASGNSLLSSGIETYFFWVLAGLGAGLAQRATPRVSAPSTPVRVADELPQWRRVARGLA